MENKKITLQGILDAAREEFIVNDKPPAMDRIGSCSYLTEDGRKCAIGLLIPDGHPIQKSYDAANILLTQYEELFDIPEEKQKDLFILQYRLHDGLCSAGAWVVTVQVRDELYAYVAENLNLKYERVYSDA